MKKVLKWLVRPLKQFIYRKAVMHEDIEAASKAGQYEKVFRTIPKHSKKAFVKEMKRVRPNLFN
ncbi:hypothetical protein [Priestia aryabhattai]